jgi:putative membrane protein
VTHPAPMQEAGPFWLPLLPVAVAAVAYGWAVLRLTRRGDRWPPGRSLSAAAAAAVLVAALLPPLDDVMDFRVHVVQHLMLAMVAPLGLVLSAPVTLALRTLPRAGRRGLLAALHRPVAQALAFAPVVLLLDVGGMYAYYLTPLFAATHDHPVLHAVVHAHMVLAGCLLSWYLVGIDPAPARRSVRGRLVVLFIAAGSHDLLAKLLYARGLPAGGGTSEQVRAGAQIMFYGGDVIEIILAVLLLASWYARGGRLIAHQHRRTTSSPGQPRRVAR